MYSRHDYPARLYRSRDGVILGVCRGLADYFNLSAFWLRVIFVVGFIVGGFFPAAVLYVLMGLLMKREPAYVIYD